MNREPNIQNIPLKTEMGTQLAQAFLTQLARAREDRAARHAQLIAAGFTFDGFDCYTAPNLSEKK